MPMTETPTPPEAFQPTPAQLAAQAAARAAAMSTPSVVERAQAAEAAREDAATDRILAAIANLDKRMDRIGNEVAAAGSIIARPDSINDVEDAELIAQEQADQVRRTTGATIAKLNLPHESALKASDRDARMRKLRERMDKINEARIAFSASDDVAMMNDLNRAANRTQRELYLLGDDEYRSQWTYTVPEHLKDSTWTIRNEKGESCRIIDATLYRGSGGYDEMAADDIQCILYLARQVAERASEHHHLLSDHNRRNVYDLLNGLRAMGGESIPDRPKWFPS